MAPLSVILQVVAFSLGMLIFSSWFSKKFAVSPEAQMQMQYKMQDLQARIREAQTNPQLMQQLNFEMATLMKDMYKKQIIPMCIRTVVFFALWGLMQLLYGKYEGFLPLPFTFGRSLFFLYLVVSFSGSLIIWVVKYLYRKLKGSAAPQKEEMFIDHAHALNSTFTITPGNPSTQSSNTYQNPEDSISSQDQNPSNSQRIGKSWKDRLNSDT